MEPRVSEVWAGRVWGVKYMVHGADPYRNLRIRWEGVGRACPAAMLAGREGMGGMGPLSGSRRPTVFSCTPIESCMTMTVRRRRATLTVSPHSSHPSGVAADGLEDPDMVWQGAQGEEGGYGI